MKIHLNSKKMGIALCAIRLATLDSCLAGREESECGSVRHTPTIQRQLDRKEEGVNIAKKSTSSIKKQARDAAQKEAKKAALELAQNENEADLLYRSAMRGKKLDSDTPQEKRATALIRNIIVQRANEAAYETAFSHLQNEEDSLHIVRSLKIGASLKANKKGTKKKPVKKNRSKVMTMSDLKVREERRLCNGQTVKSFGNNLGESIAAGLIKGFATGGIVLIKRLF